MEDLYVTLEPKFGKELFSKSYNKYGSWKDLANVLNEDAKNVRRWKDGTRSTTIKTLFKLSKLGLVSENELERNIIKITKCGGWIKNPKLPLILDENLAKIIACTFCDGGISKDNAVHYTNKSDFLIDSFKKSVKKSFGDVKLIHTDIRLGRIQIVYSGVMGIILNKIFKVPKRSKILHDTPITEVIMNADKKILKTFIRRCFDDEGWVSGGVKLSRTLEKSAIQFEEGPLFLQQLKYLLKKRFEIDVKGPILDKEKTYLRKNKKVETKSYILGIYDRKSLEKFYSEIGFDIDYKQEKLKKEIESYVLWQTPQNESLKFFLRAGAQYILDQNEYFNQHDIANKTNRTISRVQWALKELKGKGMIKTVKQKRIPLIGAYIPSYTLTNRGFEFIFNSLNKKKDLNFQEWNENKKKFN